MTSPASGRYTTKRLAPATWADFAALVEANSGVWGGCWCIGFHPDGFSTVDGNREAKRAHVDNGTVHQVLVYQGDECVVWIQYGPPAEVATIKNAKAYQKELVDLPDWRIGCVFTGSRHRGHGVARAGLTGALSARSLRPAEASSRPTPSSWRGADRSAAPTCTPARRPCSRSSASSVTVASRSGAG